MAAEGGERLIHELREHDYPDVTNGIPCCMGYAAGGPGHCTCWEPIYDQEQQPFNPEAVVTSRDSMCHDCAYRKGSPERTGEDGYAGDEDMLEHAVYSGTPFWCHQGVRKIVAYRHPTGAEIPAHAAAYGWLIKTINGRATPLKADGTPADICGGWCKKRLKVV